MTATWIFDLDNTLHRADPYIFPAMHMQMNRYLVEHLGLSEQEANEMRFHYWQRYGATLLGLIRHHPHIDPEHFLQHTHAFADLERQLAPMRGLRHVLHTLPGRKLLFTNSPRSYAKRVLHGLGIAQHFSGIIAIQDASYQPKPQWHGYRYACRRFGLVPQDCVMVEDTLVNLLPARQLGMRTVWLCAQPRPHPAVDLALRHLQQLPRHADRLVRLRAKEAPC